MPDEALSMEVMLLMMEKFDQEYLTKKANNEDVKSVVMAATFIVIGYRAGLRGEEIPMMELKGSMEGSEKGKKHEVPDLRHRVVSLIGRFITETGELRHLLPLPEITKSGLKHAMWMDRLFEWSKSKGVTEGFAFRSEDGEPVRASEYDFTKLQEIQSKRPDLIDPKIDVFSRFSMRRSARRGSNTQALCQEVPVEYIHLNNRWRQNKNQGKERSNSFQWSNITQTYAWV